MHAVDITVNNPLVSIITPCFNRRSLVLKTLKNIYESKYRPIELIVIDDGSTDDTFSVLTEFKRCYESDEFGVIIESHTKNKGAPAARNRGLDIAKGEYIQFLDSDDLLNPDKINQQIKCFQNSDADIVVCDYERIFQDNVTTYYSNKNPYKKVLRGGSVAVFSPLIKSKYAKLIRWDEKLPKNQDVDYMVKLFLLTNRISHINSSLCLYVQHNEFRIRDEYKNKSNTNLRRIKNLLIYYISHRKYFQRYVIHDVSLLVFILLRKDLISRIKKLYNLHVRNYESNGLKFR
jgi:glycosyltransferase involved in cell wall biosynthesis